VSAGWVLIVAGVLGAVLLQHGEALLMGVFMVLFGAWMLTVKGKKA
jgi:hypothetical protein